MTLQKRFYRSPLAGRTAAAEGIAKMIALRYDYNWMTLFNLLDMVLDVRTRRGRMGYR